MAKYSISNGAKVNRLLIKSAAKSVVLRQRGDERKAPTNYTTLHCAQRTFNKDF